MNEVEIVRALAEWPLIFSHLILVAEIVYAFRRWIPIAAAHFTITFAASTLYHTCRAFSTCSANLSVSHMSNFDFIGALGSISVISLQAVTNYPSLEFLALGHHDRLYGPVSWWHCFREIFWTIVIYILQLFLVVYVVMTFDVRGSIYPTLFILAIAVLGMFVKLLIVDSARHIVISKYKMGWLAAGLVWVTASVAFFPFDGENYWWAHFLWHILSFTGVFAISIGVSHSPVTQITNGKQAVH